MDKVIMSNDVCDDVFKAIKINKEKTEIAQKIVITLETGCPVQVEITSLIKDEA